MNNTTCILTIDSDTYKLHILDDIPLDQWGFPDAISLHKTFGTVNFTYCCCDGMQIGRDPIIPSKSTTIRVDNGVQYIKHIRCPVVMLLLSNGTRTLQLEVITRFETSTTVLYGCCYLANYTLRSKLT